MPNSEEDSDAITARTECETYCSTNGSCWGCSVRCWMICQWNAITTCGQLKDWRGGKIQGDVTQKTGNNKTDLLYM